MTVTPDMLTRALVESLLVSAHPNKEAPDPNHAPDQQLVREIRVWIRWDSDGRDRNEYNARRAARVICDALNHRDGRGTMKDPETDRLVAEMDELPPYRGWKFSYEYPGFFCYSSKESPYRVFCTPDWEKSGTLDIQVQTDDGHDFPDWGDILALPLEGRTGQKIFEMVRPTLDQLLGVVASAP